MTNALSDIERAERMRLTKEKNKRYLRHWKKGQSGNPAGRPKGKRDFKTDFEIACIHVADSLKLGDDPQAVHIELLKAGIKAGLKQKHPFWQEITNRIYGKVEEKVDVNLTSLNALELSLRKLATEDKPELESPKDESITNE